MEIRPVRTKADYKAALKEISALMEADPAPGTAEGDRLDVLATLVQVYEAKHVPIDPPDPVEAIRFRMEQDGLTVKDLEPLLGKSNRVYEVLNRKRPLTLAMIRRLHEGLGIPANVLIAETVAVRAKLAALKLTEADASQAVRWVRKGASAPKVAEPRARYGAVRQTARAASRKGRLKRA
jgi:HTH-type transcriptional regulator / antitoxin HigA